MALKYCLLVIVRECMGQTASIVLQTLKFQYFFEDKNSIYLIYCDGLSLQLYKVSATLNKLTLCSFTDPLQYIHYVLRLGLFWLIIFVLQRHFYIGTAIRLAIETALVVTVRLLVRQEY